LSLSGFFFLHAMLGNSSVVVWRTLLWYRVGPGGNGLRLRLAL